MGQMVVSILPGRKSVEVLISGVMDFESCHLFSEHLKQLAAMKDRELIILDFTGLSLWVSEAISRLIEFKTWLAIGQEVVIVAPQPSLRCALEFCMAQCLFRILTSKAELDQIA